MSQALFEKLSYVVNQRLFTGPEVGVLHGADLAKDINFHITNMINIYTANSLSVQEARMTSINVLMKKLMDQYEITQRILALFNDETIITYDDLRNDIYGDIAVRVLLDRIENTQAYDKIGDSYYPLKKFMDENDVTISAEVSSTETSYRVLVGNEMYMKLLNRFIADLFFTPDDN